MDLFGSEYGQVVWCYEHGNEPSGSISAGNYVTMCRNFQFLQKSSVVCS